MLDRLRGGPHDPRDERAWPSLIGVLVRNLSRSRWTGRPALGLLMFAGGVLAGVVEPLQAGRTISIATAEEAATVLTTTAHTTFDIPSQPLATALRAYSAVAKVAVLVDGELTAGRQSAPVSGVFSHEGALRSLLAGTGLTARYANPAAFTLVPVPAVPQSGSREYSRYFLAVQTALRRVLCQNEETRPDRYRMALQLWIDRSGSVERSEFLSSTGIRGRDAIISDGLKKLVIEMSQPAGLPQPVTVVVAPRALGLDTECASRVTGSQR
ncbi:STN domain-containing protein [Bradyrhizobium roseum]|uniref:STN domain-containing protein n=1 Tax=Bradyrhizobium roseum TaxID=3056648 RepID=UPI00262BF2BB|nr:STN domain-containing protein [Bradyrhizobium roseus]WKA26139.1 STN domain-containing protein [Bradyrhizobium roseus]